MMKKQADELLKDSAFFQSLCEKTNPNEVRGAFAAKGLNLPDDLLAEIWSRIEQQKQERLSSDDLSAVSGGAQHRAVPM